MTKQEMMQIVRGQLSIDYNCCPEDFDKDGVIFTVAEKWPGRREMPFVQPRLEVITMGKSTIVNASKSIMPYVKRKFAGKSGYEILTSELVYGVNPYYLPDPVVCEAVPVPGYIFTLRNQNVQDFYRFDGFHNALQYDRASKRPEMLAAAAYSGSTLVGLACASADSRAMWQIGLDVLPQHRGRGIAVQLVRLLTAETLRRGIVPYYTTDCSNIPSQKVAFKSGYCPAWSHCFKTRRPKISIFGI